MRDGYLLPPLLMLQPPPPPWVGEGVHILVNELKLGGGGSFLKTANSQGQQAITNVWNIAISTAKYLQGSN